MDVKIKFYPYEKLKDDGIKEMLHDLKKNTIIMIDAKLRPEQEAMIIQETMKNVNSQFSGIELDSLDLSKSEENDTMIKKLRDQILEFITGKKRGLTLIGPADIIKKIEKKPDDLLLHMR
ncbi:MAG: DUF2073 domain-containing protein [archaeon]